MLYETPKFLYWDTIFRHYSDNMNQQLTKKHEQIYQFSILRHHFAILSYYAIDCDTLLHDYQHISVLFYIMLVIQVLVIGIETSISLHSKYDPPPPMN
jgi:hypothetical protein